MAYNVPVGWASKKIKTWNDSIFREHFVSSQNEHGIVSRTELDQDMVGSERRERGVEISDLHLDFNVKSLIRIIGTTDAWRMCPKIRLFYTYYIRVSVDIIEIVIVDIYFFT